MSRPTKEGVRQTALRLLTGRVSDENAKVLLKIAEGEQKTSPLRDQAVRLLSGLDADGVAEFFAKILADAGESGPAREIAAKTLGRFEDKAGESALLEALKSKSESTVRAACAQALARRGSAAAVDILAKEIETAERDYLRPAFLKALAGLSPERARPALEKIIADKKEEPPHRINALILLQGVTEGKVPAAAGGLLAARDDDIGVRAQVIDFIVLVGDRSYADRIYELIEDKEENPQLRARCVEAAARMSLEGAEEKLLVLLGKTDTIQSLREAAVRGLGLMKVKGAVPKLLGVFANDRESDLLRAQAAEALAEIGDKSALNKVREVAENSPSVAVRKSAVRLLGALPDASSFEILNKISADQAADMQVRFEAVRSLGLLKDGRAYDTFVAILKEGTRSFLIQSVAIRALGDLGDERALEPLGRMVLLPTTQSFLQFPAVNAIARIGGDKAIEILETIASDEFRPSLATYARSHLEELRKQKREKQG
jgi:HEAT repeat protein